MSKCLGGIRLWAVVALVGGGGELALAGVFNQPAPMDSSLGSARSDDPCRDDLSGQKLTPFQSRQYLNRVMARCPNNEEAVLYVTNSLLKGGDHAGVKEALLRIAQDGKDSRNRVEAYSGLARIARQSGDKQEADRVYEEARRVVEEIPNIARRRQMQKDLETVFSSHAPGAVGLGGPGVPSNVIRAQGYGSVQIGGGSTVNSSRLLSSGKAESVKVEGSAGVQNGGISVK